MKHFSWLLPVTTFISLVSIQNASGHNFLSEQPLIIPTAPFIAGAVKASDNQETQTPEPKLLRILGVEKEDIASSHFDINNEIYTQINDGSPCTMYYGPDGNRGTCW